MQKLQLSLMYGCPDAMLEALQLFTKETNIQIEVEILDHQQQSILTNYAIYKSGPDISEIGSTWLSNLVSMQALRPFSDQEIRQIGNETDFVKGNWETGFRDQKLYGIPWRGDLRVINYRADLLKKAGVDEKTAFTSMDNFRDTIRKLQTLDGVAPWIINTARDSMMLHVIAPWVWDAGGHFISSDGHKTMFAEPEALSGLRTYYETFAPIITSDSRNLAENIAADKFIQGEVAGIISGHWIADSLYRDNADSVTRKNLRVVSTPGAQISGSMNLVIWKHSLRDNEARKLIRFLTRPDIQAEFIPEAGYLPVRLEALNQPLYTDDPNFEMLKKSLISGRHLNAAYMWGMVEDQLVSALYAIWQTIFENPAVDLDELLASRLIPLAKRIDQKLSHRF